MTNLVARFSRQYLFITETKKVKNRVNCKPDNFMLYEEGWPRTWGCAGQANNLAPFQTVIHLNFQPRTGLENHFEQ